MNATTTTSRDECVSNDIALRNASIMTALNHAERMIRSFARTHDLDFEDTYQHCAERMLSVWSRMPDGVQSHVGYLYGVARFELRLIVQRLDRLRPLSLDMPLTADSDETYADMLAAPDTRIQQNEKVERVVHATLHTCNLQEQQFARDEYGLETFKPLLTNWREKPATYPRLDLLYKQKDYFKAAVHAALKMSPQVQKLIQRETCVL